MRGKEITGIREIRTLEKESDPSHLRVGLLAQFAFHHPENCKKYIDFFAYYTIYRVRMVVCDHLSARGLQISP